MRNCVKPSLDGKVPASKGRAVASLALSRALLLSLYLCTLLAILLSFLAPTLSGPTMEVVVAVKVDSPPEMPGAARLSANTFLLLAKSVKLWTSSLLTKSGPRRQDM